MCKIRLQLVGGRDAAPERFERNPHDEMVETGGHDLVDRRAHPIAHHLHMFIECLLGIEGTLLDRDAAGVAGHARHPQHLGLGLDGRIGRRHDEADTLSISKSVGQDVNSQSLAAGTYMHADRVTSSPPGLARSRPRAALFVAVR